jgi:hypothetical protein
MHVPAATTVAAALGTSATLAGLARQQHTQMQQGIMRMLAMQHQALRAGCMAMQQQLLLAMAAARQ